MIIALDIDGTITRHPAFFSFLAHSCLAAGHTLLILTFREDRPGTLADLRAWNIPFTALHTWSHRDHPHEDILNWKANLCTHLKIDLLFDDDPQVLARIPTTTQTLLMINPQEHPLHRLFN